MKTDKNKLLESIDVVCLNCTQDTLDTNVCENCPVRITYKALMDKEENL